MNYNTRNQNSAQALTCEVLMCQSLSEAHTLSHLVLKVNSITVTVTEKPQLAQLPKTHWLQAGKPESMSIFLNPSGTVVAGSPIMLGWTASPHHLGLYHSIKFQKFNADLRVSSVRFSQTKAGTKSPQASPEMNYRNSWTLTDNQEINEWRCGVHLLAEY